MIQLRALSNHGLGCRAVAVSSFLAFLSFANPAAAECELKPVPNDGKDHRDEAYTALNCAVEKISEANDRIRQLEEANKEFQRGAVIAFNSDPSRPCPDKWKLFGPASGRFVIGAGDNDNKDVNGTDLGDYTVGTVSGEKLHQLTEPEMASHAHSLTLTRRWGDKSHGSPTGWGGDDGSNGDVTLSVTQAGGNQPP